MGVPLVIWIGFWGCFERVSGLRVLGLDSTKRLCYAARHGPDSTRPLCRLCGVVGDPCAVVGAPGVGPLAAFGCAVRALGVAGRPWPCEGYCRAFAASQACGRRSDPAPCVAVPGPRKPSATARRLVSGWRLTGRYRRRFRVRCRRSCPFLYRLRKVRTAASARDFGAVPLSRAIDAGGENIGHLARDRRGRIVGCSLTGAAAWRCAARDRWIGWSDATRGAGLCLVVNQQRFLILDAVRVPHLASHVLARVARRVGADYEERYGHSVHLLETFVDVSRFAGTCYRAAAGMTRG